MSGIMGLYDPVRKLRLNVVNPNEPLITKQLNETLWKKRVDKMVKTAKETLTSTWMAPILLAVLLGYNVYDGHQKDTVMTKMHDDILTLQVEKKMAENQAEKDRQTEQLIRDSRYQEDRAWRENIKNQMNKLELARTGKVTKEIQIN